MIKKTKRKDRIADLGHYTISPFHLGKILTPNEYNLFNCIRYMIECYGAGKHISNSLILLETSISKEHQLKQLKESLVKMRYISIISVDRNKGTVYQINYDSIVADVDALNKELNSVERLRIADRIRTERGLEVINKTKIKNYTNSAFDVSIETPDRYMEVKAEQPSKKKDIPKKKQDKKKEPEAPEKTSNEYLMLINKEIERGEKMIIPFEQARINVEELIEEAKTHNILIIKENNEYKVA